jgi:hypothetical protein
MELSWEGCVVAGGGEEVGQMQNDGMMVSGGGAGGRDVVLYHQLPL